MTPTELFDPNNFMATTQLVGAEGGKVLLEAGKSFPGGPVMMVFALFWAPVGPGIPAGVLLARHIPLNPALTFGLYAMSDVLAATICHPLFVGLRRLAGRVPAVKTAGQRFMNAEHELEECRLAAARRSDDGDRFAGLDGEVQAMQHIGLGV